jgi:lactoylglutathione lyase
MDSISPNLMVDSVRRTVEFYRSALGFECLESSPDGTEPDWALMQKGDIRLTFQSRKGLTRNFRELSGARIGASAVLYVTMKGLDEYYDSLKDKARILIHPHPTPRGNREFALEDLNGYIIVFAEGK